MKPEIVAAVIRRGGNRCVWCSCKLDLGQRVADRGTVCQLGLTGTDDVLVASCVACNAEFTRWWTYRSTYCVESAKRILGRHGATTSGPFVDYLESVCGPLVVRSGRMPGKRSGLLTPFTTALARIEAQRHAPLDIRRAA
jgi:hypothetical protein